MRALVNLGTMLFILLQKFFSFSNKSNFKFSKFHDVIKCLSVNNKYILLNNLGSKHGLLMKVGLFISYSERNNFKNLYKKFGLKTSSRPFRVCKELPDKIKSKKYFFYNKYFIVPTCDFQN